MKIQTGPVVHSGSIMNSNQAISGDAGSPSLFSMLLNAFESNSEDASKELSLGIEDLVTSVITQPQQHRSIVPIGSNPMQTVAPLDDVIAVNVRLENSELPSVIRGRSFQQPPDMIVVQQESFLLLAVGSKDIQAPGEQAPGEIDKLGSVAAILFIKSESSTDNLQTAITGIASDSKKTRADVLIPWSLQAANRLSYIGSTSEPDVQQSIATVVAVLPLQLLANTVTAKADAEQVRIPAAKFSDVDPLLNIHACESSTSCDENIDAAVNRAGDAFLNTQLSWSLKNLKWVRDMQGAWVVYARDYSLDSDKQGAFVRTVISRAAEEGVTLDRVVLNGREIWNQKSSYKVGR